MACGNHYSGVAFIIPNHIRHIRRRHHIRNDDNVYSAFYENLRRNDGEKIGLDSAVVAYRNLFPASRFQIVRESLSRARHGKYVELIRTRADFTSQSRRPEFQFRIKGVFHRLGSHRLEFGVHFSVTVIEPLVISFPNYIHTNSSRFR